MEKKYNYFDDQSNNLIMTEGEMLRTFYQNMTNGFLREFIALYDKDLTSNLNVLFLSHIDADGHSSSAVLRLNFDGTNNTVINLNYGFDFKTIEDKLKEADIVYISDLSPTQDEISYIEETAKNLVVWIDHHKTSKSVNIKNPDKMYKFIHAELRISAVALCWIFTSFINIITSYFKNESQDLNYIQSINLETVKREGILDNSAHISVLECPRIIKLISLYDTFADEKDIRINYGIYLHDMNINSDEGMKFWNELIMKGLDEPQPLIDEILENGDTIMKYMENEYTRMRKGSLIRCIFHIIRHKPNNETVEKDYDVAMMNVNGFSQAFGPVMNDVDGCIRYYQTSSGDYSYGCYSDKNNPNYLDCEMLAKHFGGGGHVNAAGWSSKYNLVSSILSNGKYAQSKQPKTTIHIYEK